LPRDIPIGNGNLLITFDQDYCLRDLYYPYVGKEDHVNGHKFRFGIWVDGDFRWIDREHWRLQLGYGRQALSTDVTAHNEELGITLQCTDVVDYRENIYIRDIRVKNLSPRERHVRLFFHQDFHILESPDGDTAYYDPDERAVIHYKADRYFLVSGVGEDQPGVDQYATGIKEFHGLEGTWKDAEDGTLEGYPIAQGSVDSTVSLWVTVPPFGEEIVCYWITAGKDF
jgi:glucoamylase